MKPVAAAAIFVFALVAVGHALRLVFGWEITINGITMPLWVSMIGFVIPAGLALLLWRENRT